MGANDPLHGFVEAIAARLRAGLRDELEDAVACALADHGPGQQAETPAGGRQVRGLDPHGLYSVEYVAGRWGYSKAYVRDEISREDLPRAPWRGGTIRYRGVDILRYEGVPEEELDPTNVKSLPQASGRPARRAPSPPKPPAREKPAGTRLYNDELPSLD